ncbi:cytochrome c peroxidase [uncultured Chitinophaga sp.]|uniref:cytochrome-c peroxidase n=1 Tax=uncultured Chitinophaga sp. TaxID=339340 RepID=UPI0025E8B287|nr:cytochrome c peroxidase [uncultured Chitinophaga sp.]
MKKVWIVGAIIAIAYTNIYFIHQGGNNYYANLADSLRIAYSQNPSLWPKADVDDSVAYHEIAMLPESPYFDRARTDSVFAARVELGKMLFFDPRLSGSNQISCGTCHEPEMGWSNGRSTAVGHDHQVGARNVPTLVNAWAAKSFFWDGRVNSLETQAMAPISNDIEMHMLPGQLPEKLGAIKGYRDLFRKAFNTKEITMEQVSDALADFQRTISSRRGRFDAFMSGNYKAMSDQEILGMHLFRTKARCMNCHNGPYFTDSEFHNLGLHYYGRDKYEDFGRYNITHKKEDVGKFKTPTLRDVAITRPWMHNGLFDDLGGIINLYNAGGSRPKPRPHVANDPLFPTTSAMLKKLDLTEVEKEAIVAFLHTLGTTSYRINRPDLPK